MNRQQEKADIPFLRMTVAELVEEVFDLEQVELRESLADLKNICKMLDAHRRKLGKPACYERALRDEKSKKEKEREEEMKDNKWSSVADNAERGFFFINPKTGKKEIFSFENLPITFCFRGKNATFGPASSGNEVWRKRVFGQIPFEKAAIVYVGRDSGTENLARRAYKDALELKRRWLFDATLEMLKREDFAIPKKGITVMIQLKDHDLCSDPCFSEWVFEVDGNIDGISSVAVIVYVFPTEAAS